MERVWQGRFFIWLLLLGLPFAKELVCPVAAADSFADITASAPKLSGQTRDPQLQETEVLTQAWDC